MSADRNDASKTYVVRDTIANGPDDAQPGDVCIVDAPDLGEKLFYVRTREGAWERLEESR